MASIITATTANGLVSSADNSGVLQLASGTGNLVTVPSVTGTAMVSGNMPAFSAYLSTAQTITASVNTKIAFNTEEYDTASCYDTSLYRFTPNVAGYYFINLNFWIGGSTGTYTRWNGKIYKNGSEYFRVNDLVLSGGYGTAGGCLMYLNGSTDYVEAYANIGTSGTAIVSDGGTIVNLFQGYMVRAA